MQAGVEGQQHLPDSFQVARATGSEAPQSVYVNRELDLDVWQLADKVVTSLAFVPQLAASFSNACVDSEMALRMQAWCASLLVTCMLFYACSVVSASVSTSSRADHGVSHASRPRLLQQCLSWGCYLLQLAAEAPSASWQRFL